MKLLRVILFMVLVLIMMVGCSELEPYEVLEIYESNYNENEYNGEVTEVVSSLLPHAINSIAEEEEEETEEKEEEDEETPFNLSQLIIDSIRYEDGLITLWSTDNDNTHSLLLDGRGNILIPPVLGELRHTVNFDNYSTVMQSLGRTVIPHGFWGRLAFEDVLPYGLVMVQGGNLGTGVINSDGEWIFGPKPSREYTILGYDNSEYIRVRIGGPYWRDISNTILINNTGEIVFPLPHMEIYSHVVNVIPLGYGLVAASIREGYTIENQRRARYGVFDMLGNEIIPPSFLRVRPFNEGLAIVVGRFICPDCGDAIDWRYGAIDTQGNIVIPLLYSRIVTFHEGLAGMLIGDWDWASENTTSNSTIYWGFVDTEGNEVIPPRFRNVTHFTNGVSVVDYRDVCNFACACIGPGGIALINTIGEYVIPPYIYESMWVCDTGIVFTVSGCRTISPHFEGLEFGVYSGDLGDSGDRCISETEWITNRRIGIRDSYGNVLAPSIYSHVRSYEISSEGQWFWPFVDPLTTFREGRAAVQCYYTGLWGYVDMNGYEVIPTQFVHAGTFINGVALVNVGGELVPGYREAVSNLWGINAFRSDGRHYIHSFLIRPAINGTWLIIDLYGNILESFEHMYMANVNGHVFVYSNETEQIERGSRPTWISTEMVNYRIFILERE